MHVANADTANEIIYRVGLSYTCTMIGPCDIGK